MGGSHKPNRLARGPRDRFSPGALSGAAKIALRVFECAFRRRLLQKVSLESQGKLEPTISLQDRHAAGIREVVVGSGYVLFTVAIEVPYNC